MMGKSRHARLTTHAGLGFCEFTSILGKQTEGEAMLMQQQSHEDDGWCCEQWRQRQCYNSKGKRHAMTTRANDFHAEMVLT
jgi:hypothetical protein